MTPPVNPYIQGPKFQAGEIIFSFYLFDLSTDLDETFSH